MIRTAWRRARSDGLLRTLASGAGASFAFRTTGYGHVFAAQVVPARVLPTGDFGAFWYAMTWASTLSLFGVLGYDVATVRFVPAYERTGRWVDLRGFLHEPRRTVLVASLALGAALTATAAALTPFLEPDLRATLMLAGAAVPVMSAAKLHESSLRAARRLHVAQLPLSLVRPAVIIALAAEWRGASRSMLLVAGFGVVLFQADILLTGALIDTSAAGRYVVASRVAGLAVFVLTAVNFAVGPLLSSAWSAQRGDDLRRLVRLSVLASTLATVGVATGLALFGRPLLGVFGPPFVAVYPVLLILLAGQVVNALTGPVTLRLNMTGHHRSVARVLAAGAAINVVLDLALIPAFGLVGAAVATACTRA